MILKNREDYETASAWIKANRARGSIFDRKILFQKGITGDNILCEKCSRNRNKSLMPLPGREYNDPFAYQKVIALWLEDLQKIKNATCHVCNKIWENYEWVKTEGVVK